MVVTESHLDNWVRGNGRDAQGVIVELVSRLVSAADLRPDHCRFPLGDSIAQAGEDGFLSTNIDFPPYVPVGVSYWQIGTGGRPGNKATSDYKSLSGQVPKAERLQSTFVFVTPLSGSGGWTAPKQRRWVATRRKRGDWKDVRVIDGTGLVAWLRKFPPVDVWLALRTGLLVPHVDTIENYWEDVRSTGSPLALTHDLFLVGRETATHKVNEVFDHTTTTLQLDTHFPEDIVPFVAACWAGLPPDRQLEVAGRCLVVTSPDSWMAMASHDVALFMIAGLDVDESGPNGQQLIQRARRNNHAVIYGGRPGGLPHGNRASLPSPGVHEVRDSLLKSGYPDERARLLAHNSAGRLSTLLRCIRNLSAIPGWADGTPASDLAVSGLLGAWRDDVEGDRAAAEGLSGKAYGEWIRSLREILHSPNTPLTQRDGLWKFVSRYEGWYALGSRLFDDHLENFRLCATAILQERDPKFDLPLEERHLAGVQGKLTRNSRHLRNGIADTLALLGGHPAALTSCSIGRAEGVASRVVRDVLRNADWVLWASLNDILPLMAEASPVMFLDAVESALDRTPCPFDAVFAQEGRGLFGSNYLTGLLWGLETLAWSPDFILRVSLLLGGLARRDPGGQWANRPSNSLTSIFLPWLPQSCSSIEKRGQAVDALMAETPDAGWALLMSLLPKSHQTSTYNPRPTWRQWIPEDWKERPTHGEYWQQIEIYFRAAFRAAQGTPALLAELLSHLDDVPPQMRSPVLQYLQSPDTRGLVDSDKLPIWSAVSELARKHRRFVTADWALPIDEINRLDQVADGLAPTSPLYRHQHLFGAGDFELYEEKGSYDEQSKTFDNMRQAAVDEVYENGAFEALLAFARMVKTPWRVGAALASGKGAAECGRVVPSMLLSDDKVLAQFAAGVVWGALRSHGAAWIDGLDTSSWAPGEAGQLMAYCPFTLETWNRVSIMPEEAQVEYWTRASANPYEATGGLEIAADRLFEHGRPIAALRCIDAMRQAGGEILMDLAFRALLAGVNSKEDHFANDTYHITELIGALQGSPGVDETLLGRVEWAYLPLLDRHNRAAPRVLERRLATEPKFFCEVIRLVFRSRKAATEDAKDADEKKQAMATNAYRLLSDWSIPPGLGGDGTLDGEALLQWLAKAKEECLESGHFESGMSMFGRVLVHCPPDPDGLWLHRAAAQALNGKDAVEMRDGFTTELFNSRGVYSSTGGSAEVGLAKRFIEHAVALESAGFVRLATSMRKLAASYEHQAKIESERDPFE